MVSRWGHPSARVLERFLRGEERPEEGAFVRQHLGHGCLRCLREVRHLTGAARQEGEGRLKTALASREPEERSRLLESLARRMERQAVVEEAEERLAGELLEDLLRLPREERIAEVRGSGKYQLLGLARVLTARARAEVSSDVVRATDLATLAVEVAEHLEGRAYPPRVAADEAGLAWAALANARRVAGELVQAERDLQRALGFLDSGSGDALVELESLSLLGSLRLSQGRFTDAAQVLERGTGLARELGVREQAARLALQLGKAYGEGGSPERAVAVLEESAAILEAMDDSRRPPTACSSGHSGCWSSVGSTKPTRSTFGSARSGWKRSRASPTASASPG